ncbi:hypothetical protein ABPG75_008305 [Micractinium tetrahymenae]
MATPRVRLLLQPEGPQEQVLQVTAGEAEGEAHEVVEARHGGVALVFARKRKEPPAEAAAPVPSTCTQHGAAASTHTRRASLFRTPAAQRALTAAATAVAAESPYADEVEMLQPLGERLLEGLAALPDRAPPADRLLAFCAGLGAAAVEAAAAAPARAAALADVLAAFQRSLGATLADGGVALAAPPRPPPTPSDEGEVEQQAPGYRVDLEARKAGLRARLANFEKEEAEWHALLYKVHELDQQQLMPAADEAAAGSSGEAAAGEAAAPDEAGLSSVASEPGMYGQLADQAAQRSSSEEQEAEAALAALEAVHVGVHRHLAMQVEGVCKLVGDVEELVERASRAAAAVQAEYHAEKFRAFPHINSPARLIRELVRAPGPAPGSKAPQQQRQEAADGKENAGAAMEVA